MENHKLTIITQGAWRRNGSLLAPEAIGRARGHDESPAAAEHQLSVRRDAPKGGDAAVIIKPYCTPPCIFIRDHPGAKFASGAVGEDEARAACQM
jgi:hypothetical protein